MAQSINPVPYDQLPEANELKEGDQLFVIQENLFKRINLSLITKVELTEESGSGTDVSTPSISPSSFSTILQVIWNKIRQIVNAKQSAIPAGENGYLATHSGTLGDFGSPKNPEEFALANAELLVEEGTSTDISTPAVSSKPIVEILQTVWKKIRQLVNVVNTKVPKVVHLGAVDFNTVTDVGFFTVNGNLNAPTTSTGNWGVFNFRTYSTSVNYLVQVANFNTSVNLYYRKLNNGVWDGWNRIALYSQIPENSSGTWTPSGSGITGASGYYERNGNIVTFFSIFNWNGSSTQTIRVSRPPFAPRNQQDLPHTYSWNAKTIDLDGITIVFANAVTSLTGITVNGTYIIN